MITAAWQRLVAKGLAVTGGSLSVREPGNSRFGLLEGQGSGLGSTRATSTHSFDETRDTVAAAHANIYRQRPDVGAVFVSRQPWALALGELPEPMPAVFDEQARHLGKQVVALDLSLAELADEGRYTVRGAANAYLLDDAVICLGMTLERVIFNAELLEKCAQAYVLATLTGGRVHELPWLVRHIANRRLQRDERSAALAHARGEVPSGLNAY